MTSHHAVKKSHHLRSGRVSLTGNPRDEAVDPGAITGRRRVSLPHQVLKQDVPVAYRP